ncbi:S41 family peptidase [Stakelama marina]|nr:S41 family peptidase [Stakelama marina]
MRNRVVAGLALVALLSGCGGGGSGGTVSTPPTSGSGGGSGTASAGGTCSLLSRQQWAFDQLDEWYLFPDTLPNNLDPASYSTVQDYIDALTANARAQGKDRHFTYLTSIAEEDAYYNSGQTAGFGFRITLAPDNSKLLIAEAFEGAPALKAGIDRGTAITAIGTSENNLQTVSELIASGGGDALNNALGPSTAGTTRYFRITDASGTRVVSVTKADYDIEPVSSRYGAQILSDGGQQYGYINLRTFISTADPALRDAFAKFRAAGVDKVIVDLRYNGGGLVSVAELMGNLLGGDHSTSDVFDHMTFRPSKASENTTAYFAPQPQSIGATRIAFIGTRGTASASELVVNAFIPYLHTADGLIGTNTYGKPVGQIAVDRSECDDRFRIIAFGLHNANNQGGYFDGLAGTVEASCQADDDLSRPMGDPQEASTRAALDFLEGKSCTQITAAGAQTTQAVQQRRKLLQPAVPSTPQREVPGLY